jgi:hypothetical protein
LTGLSEVVDTLQELQRLHQLNVELLEQLDVTCTWLIDNHIKMPNESTFYSLLSKTKAILEEIHDKETKTLQYTIINRRKVTVSKTDEEVPVPLWTIYKGGIVFESTLTLAGQSFY